MKQELCMPVLKLMQVKLVNQRFKVEIVIMENFHHGQEVTLTLHVQSMVTFHVEARHTMEFKVVWSTQPHQFLMVKTAIIILKLKQELALMGNFRLGLVLKIFKALLAQKDFHFHVKVYLMEAQKREEDTKNNMFPTYWPVNLKHSTEVVQMGP